MGLTAPAPEAPTRGMEEALLGALLSPCSTSDPLLALALMRDAHAQLAFMIAAQCLDVRQMLMLLRHFGFVRMAAAAISAAAACALATTRSAAAATASAATSRTDSNIPANDCSVPSSEIPLDRTANRVPTGTRSNHGSPASPRTSRS